MSKILAEIIKVSKAAPQTDDEGDAAFRRRLVREMSKVADDVFEGLSEPTQQWLNAAVKAVKAKKPLPTFPDADDAPVAATKKEQPASAKKAAATKAIPAAEKALPKKANADNKAKRAGGESAECKLRKHILSNPDESRDKLLAWAEKAIPAIRPSSISGTRHSTLAVLRLLKELGFRVTPPKD
jgi:hypothetical protein